MFVKRLIETRNPTQAAMEAYEPCKRKNAAIMAWQNMRKPVIAELLDEMGISDTDIVRVLKRNLNSKSKYFSKELGKFIESDNGVVQLKAAEISLKLKGHLQDRVIKETNFPTQINIQYELKERPKGEMEDSA